MAPLVIKMKSKLLACSFITLTLAGCMMPNYKRLVPETKSVHMMIFSPIYGWAVIDTRAAGDTNTLPPLPQPQPEPVVIIGK